MKQVHSILYVLTVMTILVLSACSRSKFAQLNTDPLNSLTIPPETELTQGELSMFNNSGEAFYDFYFWMRPWTQLWVFNGGGNGQTFTSPGSNINFRYGQLYSSVGPPLSDVQHIISNYPAATKARYAYLNAIAGINLCEYAFYVSDANGAMPYSQAFQARANGNLTPTWDTQEGLFDTLENQLQAYVATLETQQPIQQDTGGNDDLIYQGKSLNWIKAANSLRLRIAMRLINQNPSQLTTIANQVLADPIGLIDNTSDQWVFQGGPTFLSGSNNWDPIANAGSPCMEKNVVDFLLKTQDPRVGALLQPSLINSQAMFDSAQAQNQIPAGVKWDGQIYRGQYANPDSTTHSDLAYYFTPLNFTFNNIKQTGFYPSVIQPYILDGQYSTTGTSGTGLNSFPVITFADVCFMRAELVLRGLSNDAVSAQQLYTMGVTASLQDFDAWAQAANTPGYTPITAAQISNYLLQPGIAYQSATALEQVLDQEYINDYMNPNEAWALIKRTGYPSPTGKILQLEALTTGGNPLVMPRRYAVTFPALGDLNYNNDVNAINAELALPGFGAVNDLTGKVWWDQ